MTLDLIGSAGLRLTILVKVYEDDGHISGGSDFVTAGWELMLTYSTILLYIDLQLQDPNNIPEIKFGFLSIYETFHTRKDSYFLRVAPYILVYVYGCFGGTCSLCLQGR
jgi:hypothetical protein